MGVRLEIQTKELGLLVKNHTKPRKGSPKGFFSDNSSQLTKFTKYFSGKLNLKKKAIDG